MLHCILSNEHTTVHTCAICVILHFSTINFILCYFIFQHLLFIVLILHFSASFFSDFLRQSAVKETLIYSTIAVMISNLFSSSVSCVHVLCEVCGGPLVLEEGWQKIACGGLVSQGEVWPFSCSLTQCQLIKGVDVTGKVSKVVCIWNGGGVMAVLLW